MYTVFAEKHLRWSLFLKKLHTFSPTTLLTRDSNTGVCFPMINENFFRTRLLLKIYSMVLFCFLEHISEVAVSQHSTK